MYSFCVARASVNQGGFKVLARTSRKRDRITVKEMRFRNDPIVRLYEKTQDWLQERGRPVVIAAGIVAGLIVVYTAGYYFFEYRESKAAAAFAEAFEKYRAPVLDTATPATPNPVGKSYADEKVKWQESADAFERLANEYSSYYAAIGRYYAGLSYLHLDRDRAVQLLQQAADKNEQPTSDLARLAIAESYLAAGDSEKAIPVFEGLLSSSHVPGPSVQMGIGRAHEKAGNTEKAVAAYFEAAKAEREAGVGGDAEKRLSALAPDRLKDLPPPATPGVQGRR